MAQLDSLFGQGLPTWVYARIPDAHSRSDTLPVSATQARLSDTGSTIKRSLPTDRRLPRNRFRCGSDHDSSVNDEDITDSDNDGDDKHPADDGGDSEATADDTDNDNPDDD